MKHMASIVAALLMIASIATARSAFGADIATVVSNATDVTVTSDTLVPGEALYVYTQTNTEFNLTLSSQSKVWVLVVGGGGAGGTGATASDTAGQAGGGGGGGFIETNGLKLAGGTYTISVGAGGAPSTWAGKNGGDSYIRVGSADMFLAKGGGGGVRANRGPGIAGASGGGGSLKSGETGTGGTAEDGQGNVGGKGKFHGGGGGGGGAGGAGADTPEAQVGGDGGAGKASAITGKAVAYAGGGGGGASGGTSANGGGGGRGGSSSAAPTQGTDGLGGGGGGGGAASTSANRNGAKGGSGIVIIRVIKIYGEIAPPVANNFEYTGSPITVWEGDEECTVTGDDLTQTAVGTYTFTATPKDGSCWLGTGGSTDPTNITWEIKKSTNYLKIVSEGWIVGSGPIPTPKDICEYKVTDESDEPKVFFSSDKDSGYVEGLPSDVGFYWVKASIAAKPDCYDEASAGPQKFRILGANGSPMPDGSLKYFAPITIDNDVSATSKVTIAIAKTHNWVADYNDGLDVRFCDFLGNLFPSKLEPPKADGSMEFNVDVPPMKAGGVFYMCWGETVGKSAPTTVAPSGASVTAKFSFGETVVDMSLTLKNWIRDLKMSGFRLGDSPTEPKCVAKIGTVKYQYSTSATSGFKDWDPSGTFDSGMYYMRAIVESSTAEGYGGASSESPVQFRILGETESPLNALAWFAPVTVTGTLDSPASVTVTLPATLDYKTIYNDGSDIRFYDADGNPLPSKAATPWATDGTAKFNVELSEFSTSYKFYVCWGPVVGMELKETTDPTAGAAERSVSVDPPAVRDETKWPLVNHWATAPSFPPRWDVEKPASYTPGDPAYGTFKLLLRDAADPTGELTVITDLPNKAGDFELIACVDAGDYWAGMTNDPVEVSVYKHDSSISLTRDHGAEGRVLLMNDDTNSVFEIRNQGYFATNTTDSTFWVHKNVKSPPVAISVQRNMSNEIDHVLWASGSGDPKRLWTLKSCRHGNIFLKSDTSALSAGNNFLPWGSDTALDFDGSSSHTRHGAGHVVMMNTNACIISSCFDDGIGTIYFDAVNSGIINAPVSPDDFKLKIWVATDCKTSVGDILPDVAPLDEYVREFDTVSPPSDVLTTNVNWRLVEVMPFRVEDGVVVDTVDTVAKTDVVALDVAKGAHDNWFYRIVAQLDIKRPARFKIERASDRGGNADQVNSYISIDNIIVSYPAMRASITTYGDYDSVKKGKQVIGQQAALSEVFPSVGSDSILARGLVSFYTNGGRPAESINTNDFITSARFNYRWRYLDQSFYHDGTFSSVDDGKFASVRLSKSDDYKISTRPLDLPGLPGDIEYWYELVLGAPYYEYHDYSGLDAGIGDYTEEVAFNEAHADSSFSNLPSGGTNWFVRVREGASNFERMNLITTEALANLAITNTETIAMDLIGDHQWRGLVIVTNKTERDLTFYIQGVNPQVDGETVYDKSGANNVEYRAREATVSITNSPFAGVMTAVGEERGYRAKLHYLTNVASYVEFQFNDETRAISISHADYQDFNTWFSSRWENDGNLKFYSSAHETNSTTVATKRYPAKRADGTTPNAFADFAETPRMATAWAENFAIDSGQTQAGFPKNVPFPEGSERTPHGWLADQGMWVAQNWGMTNSTDFALQMEGRGKGSVTFNLTPTPNGLDTIEFSTRLAQFNEFDDISFSWENIIERKNYTIAAQACFDADPTFANFSGEASVSLFTGYVPNKGCYEYRITIYNLDAISTSDGNAITSVRHAIYKWARDGGKIVPNLLAEVNQFTKYKDNDGTWKDIGWYWTKGVNDEKKDTVNRLPLGVNNDVANGAYSGMFMSFSNATDSVVITAGVSKDPGDKKPLNVNFAYDTTMMQIGCVDSNPVTKFGTYGVAIKNCPGRILYPRVYSNASVPIPSSGTNSVDRGWWWSGPVGLLGSTADSTPEWSSTNDKLNTRWGLRPGRIVAQTGGTWGLFADTNITQQIGVYTMPAGSTNNWTCLTNIAVGTFNNDKHVISLQSTQQCHVKFASSAKPDDIRTDIVIDDITLTQWCGQNVAATNAVSSYGYYKDFYCTGTWISNYVFRTGGKTTTGNVALLAPRRAESPTTPVGIRSPYLEGLGSFTFSFCDAATNAELVLQRWMGDADNLYGHLTDSADASGWLPLTNWTFTADEKTFTRTYYCGERAPSNGVFRLVIPQDKVAEAYGHKEYDPNWGAITITGVYCYDEPAFDLHSWWGWNFLTTGWSDGHGNKYAAIDDHDDGAVGVINNTVDDTNSLVTGDKNDYDKNDPFIQSPTFNGRNVGEITFRARCYSPNTAEPSCITVWGAKSGDLQKTGSWHPITNFYVSSSAYTRYTAKCADEQGFAAIRIGVANVTNIVNDYKMDPVSKSDPSRRVLIDEIVIRERVKPEVGFRIDFVRPFRMGLTEHTAIANIASRDQQPLLGEQFGFQAEVEVTGLADEVDLSRTPVVTLSYYPKAEPWGYLNWKDAPEAVLNIDLPPAEGTNLVFRSMDTAMESFAGPFEADEILGYGVVQYYVTVKYWDKGGDEHTTLISAEQWKMPSWYYGFDDPNAKGDAAFSPFTVLDTVSPGRAWFNEINFSDEKGNNANQFVEICFPAGYDMTGWRIYRYGVNGYQDFLASLGVTTGVPSTKEANGGDPNFAFFALTSRTMPVANADAFWSISPADCSGINSYGFQLVRPSGIIEQQVVVQSKIGSGRYAIVHLGTNVVAQLETLVGGTWELVGVDTNAAIKSSGVFQNAGSDPADWNDTMDMSPGGINGNQTIPPDWFLPPSGTNVWVSLSTIGNLVWIVDGDSRIAASSFIIPIDVETNICFETAPWYRLDSLMRDVTNDVTAAAVRSAGPIGVKSRWTYAFKESVKNSATLQASAKPDEEVLLRGQLNPDDPYTPAVMNWLVGGMANGTSFTNSVISTNCFFQGLSANSRREYLPLKERYWLDIDPTSDDWDLRGGMGEAGNLTNSIPTVPVVKPVYRYRPDFWPERVTNRVVTVAMMISNKVDHALSYPPNRLQGLGGEKSDVVGARNWTSETFKVMMSLIKSETGPDSIDVSDRYWPMAMFVFNDGSFGKPDGPNPFSARIEVLDPMSTGSPAYSYGWWKYPGSTYGYKWDLSHGIYFRAPSMLNATNTWDKTWEANDDY